MNEWDAFINKAIREKINETALSTTPEQYVAWLKEVGIEPVTVSWRIQDDR